MIDNGIEDLETILELEDDHVSQMGIPLGHKLKIIKKIKDLRIEKGMEVPQSREGGTRTQDIQYEDGVSSKPVSQNVYEELPPPSEEQEKENKKVSFAPGTKGSYGGSNDQIGIEKLADGVYNEAESHNGFLEALSAWRNAGKPSEEKKSKNKKPDLNDVEESWKRQQDPAKKGSFFANIDSSAKDFDLGSIPTWQEGGT